MKYVRLRFSEEEYSKIKKNANVSNMIVSKYIKNKMIKERKSKDVQLFYFLNTINSWLELISNDIKENKYHENNSKVFFYLYLIEQHLQKYL